MTLDDLELLQVSIFVRISRDVTDLGGNKGKMNEGRPVLSTTEL